jgi:hypothetical protein
MLAITEMNESQIREEINAIQGRIQVLEWDKSRKQINPAKLTKLNTLLKRKEELQTKIEELL